MVQIKIIAEYSTEVNPGSFTVKVSLAIYAYWYTFYTI